VEKVLGEGRGGRARYEDTNLADLRMVIWNPVKVGVSTCLLLLAATRESRETDREREGHEEGKGGN